MNKYVFGKFIDQNENLIYVRLDKIEQVSVIRNGDRSNVILTMGTSKAYSKIGSEDFAEAMGEEFVRDIIKAESDEKNVLAARTLSEIRDILENITDKENCDPYLKVIMDLVG